MITYSVLGFLMGVEILLILLGNRWLLNKWLSDPVLIRRVFRAATIGSILVSLVLAGLILFRGVDQLEYLDGQSNLRSVMTRELNAVPASIEIQNPTCNQRSNDRLQFCLNWHAGVAYRRQGEAQKQYVEAIFNKEIVVLLQPQHLHGVQVGMARPPSPLYQTPS